MLVTYRKWRKYVKNLKVDSERIVKMNVCIFVSKVTIICIIGVYAVNGNVFLKMKF